MSTSLQPATATGPPPVDDAAAMVTIPQYRLTQILAIWAAAAAPMGTILWVVMPWVARTTTSAPGLIYLPLITAGLLWQGILAYLILRREVVPFTWPNVKRRLWLNPPLHPVTNEPSWWLLAWTVPVGGALLMWDQIDPLAWLNNQWVAAFPMLRPPEYALIENLAEPAVGQWWLLGVLLILIVFNYVLGEELIFRGVLLPKMYGTFGKWAFVANGILFSAYHIHLIWALPSQIILRDWIYAWASQRYRSYWVSALIHCYDALFLVVLFPAAILGKLS